MSTASIRSTLNGLTSLGLIAMSLLTLPAIAQTAKSQDTNISGVVAEITECSRADGVLTIRLRLRNTTDNKARVSLISGRNYDAYYVTAANKKYFVLRDSEKTPLTLTADGFGNVTADIEKGASYVWWAKFPAPPADVKKVSLFTPIAPPFDNIPITD